MDHGKLSFNIEQILKERNISKNQICKDLEIPRSNCNRYCQNRFERIDAGTLITYHAPEE